VIIFTSQALLFSLPIPVPYSSTCRAPVPRVLQLLLLLPSAPPAFSPPLSLFLSVFLALLLVLHLLTPLPISPHAPHAPIPSTPPLPSLRPLLPPFDFRILMYLIFKQFCLVKRMIRGFRVETILTYSQTLNRQTAPLSLTRQRRDETRTNKRTGREREAETGRENKERHGEGQRERRG